jgi:hypothetical protein
VSWDEADSNEVRFLSFPGQRLSGADEKDILLEDVPAFHMRCRGCHIARASRCGRGMIDAFTIDQQNPEDA